MERKKRASERKKIHLFHSMGECASHDDADDDSSALVRNKAGRRMRRADRRRSEHVKVGDLLAEANLPSVNQMIARAAITMTWTALVCGKGPIAPVLGALKPASGTRAATDGRLNNPATTNAIVASGVKLWNRHHDRLSNIKTKFALKSFITKEVWKELPI